MCKRVWGDFVILGGVRVTTREETVGKFMHLTVDAIGGERL